MLRRGELGAAISGVRRLVRLDVTGFDYFDASLPGFWNSFWAAAILAPFTAALIAHGMELDPPESPGRFVAFQAIGYVIGWLAYPLVMVRISAIIGRGDRYFTYMVAYNWFHLVEVLAWGPVAVLGLLGVLSPALEVRLSLLVLVVLLGYEWFIARRALNVAGGTAAALVAIDFLLSLVIDRLSDALP